MSFYIASYKQKKSISQSTRLNENKQFKEIKTVKSNSYLIRIRFKFLNNVCTQSQNIILIYFIIIPYVDEWGRLKTRFQELFYPPSYCKPNQTGFSHLVFFIQYFYFTQSTRKPCAFGSIQKKNIYKNCIFWFELPDREALIIIAQVLFGLRR